MAALIQAQIDIATLETEVKHLTTAVNELKSLNQKIFRKLDETQDLLTEAKGGWKALMFLGGAGATLGAFLTWFFEHFTFK